MAGSTIGTPAVGSAEDKTGQTLQQLKQKVQALEGSAAQASKRMDSLASGTSDFWLTQERHTDISRRMSKDWQRQSIARGMSRANVVTNAPGFWAKAAQYRKFATRVGGPAVVAGIVEKLLTEGARQSNEVRLMENAGATPAEVVDAKARAQELARRYSPVARIDFMHMLRNMRPFVASYQEAARMIEPLAKLRVIWQAANPEADAKDLNETFDKLVLSAASGGFTNDASKFATYIDNVARAVNVYGRLAEPDKLFTAARHSGTASDRWSADFVGGVLPGLIQDAGGAEQAGKQLAAIDRLARSEIDEATAKDLGPLGLLETQFVRNSTGKLVPVRRLAKADLASSDPDQWVTRIYAPALAQNQKKLKDRDGSAKITERIFGEDGAQFVKDRIAQSDLYERNRASAHQNKSLDAASDIMRKDFWQSLRGLENQGNALAGDIGERILDWATYGINGFSNFVFGTATAAPNRSPAALANRLAARDIARNIGSGFGSAFGLGRRGRDKTWDDGWALGVAGSSVAPGLLSFGFGEAGVDPRAAAGETYSAGPGALRFSPRRGAVQGRGRFSDVVPSLRNASRQSMAVTVTAEPIRIESSVRVEASSELVRAAASVKTAKREAKLSARASGPGSTGSTEFGNQHS